MPQTVEAIDHAKAADVPIIVAINKMDRPDANPDRVLQQVSEHGLVPEKWGGDTICVEISALQRHRHRRAARAGPAGRRPGRALRAPDRARRRHRARGQPRGRARPGRHRHGPKGPARGRRPGRRRRRLAARSRRSSTRPARPSSRPGPPRPVQVLGFSEPPFAGDEMRVADDLGPRALAGRGARAARAAHRPPADRRGVGRAPRGPLRADPARRDRDAQRRAQGRRAGLARGLHRVAAQARARRRQAASSCTAASAASPRTTCSSRKASNATIIGFNVRPDRRSREMAESEDVEIRTYEIIYKLIEEIEAAMLGLLAPESRGGRHRRGRGPRGLPRPARSARSPAARCARASSPVARRSASCARASSSGSGTITSLRRFKDDAREVAAGFECGIGLSDYQDLKEGDLIETFEEREIPRIGLGHGAAGPTTPTRAPRASTRSCARSSPTPSSASATRTTASASSP